MRRLRSTELVVACLGGTPALADTSKGGWNVSAKPDANGVWPAQRKGGTHRFTTKGMPPRK